MSRFLLTLIETSGRHEHVTRHLIEAADRQMVKYHFHRTLKDWGYTDSQYRKHNLEGDGTSAEIQEIKRLDSMEYKILDKYIGHWNKV
jgi:hypothetical protein